MAINFLKQNFFAAVILLFAASLLSAQEGGYYIDYSGPEPRFIQRLVWSNDEYAQNYEVIIQDERGQRDFFSGRIETAFIEISLPPGKYRYTVTPYDLLGLPGENSGWTAFEVLEALQPSISRFLPHSFFMDQNVERVLNIAGDNLLEESEIYLRDGMRSLFPIKSIFWGGSRARLFFDDELLLPGNYDIYVMNPGGLETSLSGFTIGYLKPVDIFVKVTWAPMIPIMGNAAEFFGTTLYPASASISIEAVSSKRSSFNGGLEVVLGGYFINPAFTFNASLRDMLEAWHNGGNGMSGLETDINIVMQRRFFHRRMAFSFRFGVGIALLNGFGSYKPDDFVIVFNGGISYMVLLKEIFYVEIGADFSYFNASDVPSGFIKPKLSVTWQF